MNLKLSKTLNCLLLSIMLLFSMNSIAGSRRLYTASRLSIASTQCPATSAQSHQFSIDNNSFKYNGYYNDVESDNYYLNARYYSPELMRFINRDSYDLPNRYTYCDANPITNLDPSGHNALDWILPHGVAGWIGFTAAAIIGFAAAVFVPPTWGYITGEMIAGAVANGGGTAIQQTIEHHFNYDIALQAGIGAAIGTIGAGLGRWRLKARFPARPSFAAGYDEDLRNQIREILNRELPRKNVAATALGQYQRRDGKFAFKQFVKKLFASSSDYLEAYGRDTLAGMRYDLIMRIGRGVKVTDELRNLLGDWDHELFLDRSARKQYHAVSDWLRRISPRDSGAGSIYAIAEPAEDPLILEWLGR